jgi:hypothetical protein
VFIPGGAWDAEDVIRWPGWGAGTRDRVSRLPVTNMTGESPQAATARVPFKNYF